MALPSFQYSGVSYAGQPAGTTTFALTTSGGKSIGYLLSSHVHVYSSINNGDTLVELTRPAQWDFNPAGTAVVLKTGIASGVAIVLQRITPQDSPYTEFGQGTLLTADQLNDATTFLLYVTQESDDQVEAGVADATLALGQSATALSQSTVALAQSTDAKAASGTALSEASQAVSTANDAKATAEGAATVSGVAIQRADSSLAQSSTAATVSADADAKATAALAAVVDASIYVTVANVAALPPAPTDGYRAQVADSTGIEGNAGIVGLPVGFVGDAGAFVRLNYNAATSKWQYASYGANDPDNRYAKSPLPAASTSAAGIVQLSSAVDSTSQAVAATASAVKTVSDAAAAASSTAVSATSAAAAAQATASAALPKSGGTMTGDIVFSPNQAKATISGTFGITTLSDSTSNSSSTTAATSKAVKDAFDLGVAAMPKTGGTFSGGVTFGTTTAATLPVGTSVQRPTGATGMVRFNTTISQYEGYNGTTWSPIGGGAKVSATAPSPATDGMQWYDLNDGRTYVYVNDGDSSQWVDGNPPGSSVVASTGFKNAIINGNFDIWQRGTSFPAWTGYAVDRFRSLNIGTTGNVTRQSFAPGQTDVPGEPSYFIRTVVSSVTGANNYALLDQLIEDVRTFAGQQVTFSFWAKADTTKNIGICLQQYFGTGTNSPSGLVIIAPTKVSIGTGWQKVTLTATTPSLSGKTIGNGNNGAIVAQIWFDAGSNYNANTDTLGHQSGTFDIAQVQVESGPVATPFERRPIGTELALCQRYYEQAESAWTFLTVYKIPFKVIKRGIPTVGVLTLGGSAVSVNGGAYSGVDSCRVESGGGSDFSWTADAEL
jgi:hypothetical protein